MTAFRSTFTFENSNLDIYNSKHFIGQYKSISINICDELKSDSS